MAPRSVNDTHQSLPPGLIGPALSRDRSPIEKLDYDTLSLILQYAMAADVEPDDFEGYFSYRQPRASFHTIHYPGRVSRSWHNVCISNPSLWTDIVYIVDAPEHTPPFQHARLQTYLQRSHPLNIRLYLCTRHQNPRYSPFGEGEPVQAALAACEGHMERVEVLMVDTIQSSSLPNAMSLLGLENGGVYRLPKLRRLILASKVEDTIFPFRPISESIPSSFHALNPASTSLTTFIINGRNLLSMLKLTLVGAGVEEFVLKMPMLEVLGINNLNSCLDNYSFRAVNRFFVDILPSFPRLRSIALDHFELMEDQPGSIHNTFVHRSTPEPLIPLSLCRLIIKRASPRSIELALRWITPITLVLIEINFWNPISLSGIKNLVLVNINVSVDGALQKTIARWNGDFLELRGCLCVDKQFWDQLLREIAVQGGGLDKIEASMSLGYFKSVKVIDCPAGIPT